MELPQNRASINWNLAIVGTSSLVRNLQMEINRFSKPHYWFPMLHALVHARPVTIPV